VHELVSHAAAHHADVGLGRDGGQGTAPEDTEVCPVLGLVLPVQAVGVLHGELAGTDEAGPGTRVVAPLRLDLVDERG